MVLQYRKVPSLDDSLAPRRESRAEDTVRVCADREKLRRDRVGHLRPTVRPDNIRYGASTEYGDRQGSAEISLLKGLESFELRYFELRAMIRQDVYTDTHSRFA